MKFFSLIAFIIVLHLPATAQKRLTPVDAKSKVEFSIRNIGIPTHGTLSGLSGVIQIHESAIERSSVNVTVAVSTINTDNSRRDKHLRHADFFEVEKYPVIRIQSSSISRGEKAGQYIFNGNLTIKSTTQPIRFPFEAIKLGKEYIFKGSFKIDRLDFGVGESSATLSDEVQVMLEIHAE